MSNPQPTILVIEDELQIRRFLRTSLTVGNPPQAAALMNFEKLIG